MSKKVIVRAGTLVILSGLPGSGKSSLQNSAINLPRGAWISSDALREQTFGVVHDLDSDGQVFMRLHEAQNVTVFSIMRMQVRARLQEGLTTVVDMTNLTDNDRKEWVELAKEMGRPVIVLIMATSLDQAIANNANRMKRVPVSAIQKMNQPQAKDSAQLASTANPTPPQGFMRTSKYPHEVIEMGTVLEFRPLELDGTNYDVIGDTHGLLDDLLELLGKAGWRFENKTLSHPDNRKLLFLGDLVDRGPKSIEMLRVVKKAVEDGVAEVIMGNHEKKLVRFYDMATTGTMPDEWSSAANADTGRELLTLSTSEATSLVDFMRYLPPYKVLSKERIAFVHGDIHRFDPFVVPVGDMIYGQSGFKPLDSDAAYQRRFDAQLNEYTMFRGHVPQKSEQDNVFSLERSAYQKGELVLMRLDSFIEGVQAGLSNKESFAKAILTHQCAFDYAQHSKKWDLLWGLKKLVKTKLVTQRADSSFLFSTFKYSKRTFWENKWNESPWLLKARGIVLDEGGNIISHPFDKCFNYKENGAGEGLSDEVSVVVPDKLNGFLGIISGNPFKKGELIVHTQGGFSSEFVDYIKEYAYASPTRGNISRFLAKNNVTLMFEVLHPSDPHIIEYAEDMYGLHLIGVRGKNLHDEPWPEHEVDAAAAEMMLRRPGWTRMPFGQLRSMIREARTEGWMVRADTEKQEFLFKIKTPYYLTTKFLGRLSDKKIKHMYGSPSNFKQTVDEEFYPIVDNLVATIPEVTFLSMNDEERVFLVRGIINKML